MGGLFYPQPSFDIRRNGYRSLYTNASEGPEAPTVSSNLSSTLAKVVARRPVQRAKVSVCK